MLQGSREGMLWRGQSSRCDQFCADLRSLSRSATVAYVMAQMAGVSPGSSVLDVYWIVCSYASTILNLSCSRMSLCRKSLSPRGGGSAAAASSTA